MCQVFGVSRSGYYNWVQHEPSDRKQSEPPRESWRLNFLRKR
ncbi:transposase [Shigella flexneri K-1770]|nr:putative transposase [Shigella flexneri VA-6]EGK28151.1 putative transposase [Shigella flexneri VA-6]EIQ18054.1 transposase [Shigella flexneri K-1770]